MKAAHVAALLPICIAGALGACDLSPEASLHALRAECGRDARAWTKAYVTEFRRSQPKWGSSMQSHYNACDHRCYANVSISSDFDSEGPTSFFSSQLVDVDENRGIGAIDQESKRNEQTSVTSCTVTARKCANFDEWKALIKPYMEE
jgi:hypothetical protein